MLPALVVKHIANSKLTTHDEKTPQTLSGKKRKAGEIGGPDSDVAFYALQSNAVYKEKKDRMSFVKEKLGTTGSWRRDHRFAKDQSEVWVNMDTKKVLTVFRGTSTDDLTSDVMTDIGIALGYEGKTGRFKKSVQEFEKIVDKYDDYEHVVAGHSLGGAIAYHVKQTHPDLVDEVHMFNPGTGLGKEGVHTDGVHGHYVIGDPISALGYTANHEVHMYKRKKDNNPHTIDNFI